jgi:hypothetical protein
MLLPFCYLLVQMVSDRWCSSSRIIYDASELIRLFDNKHSIFQVCSFFLSITTSPSARLSYPLLACRWRFHVVTCTSLCSGFVRTRSLHSSANSLIRAGGDMWTVSTVFFRMISCVSVTTGFYRHCKTERITVPRCTNNSMEIECISSLLLEEERTLSGWFDDMLEN